MEDTTFVVIFRIVVLVSFGFTTGFPWLESQLVEAVMSRLLRKQNQRKTNFCLALK